jgi:hypothetical protein
MARRHWSRERVIEAIRQWRHSGRPLTRVPMTAVWKNHSALYANAKRLFGRWLAALRAAGLAPDPPRKWSKQDVLDAIRERQRSGLSLVGLWRTARPLNRAAKRHFGTWYEALRAAGISDCPRCWTREQVVADLQACHRDGIPPPDVWRTNKPLFSAARRLFGSWPRALEASGVPCRRRRKWSEEAVLTELRDWHRGSTPSTSINYAARHWFGSTQEAWIAVQLEPPYLKWTPQRVIEAIQDRYVRGSPARSAGFGDHSLRDAARRIFGNWPAAMAAAGLPPSLGEQKTRSWDRETVIEAIRQWRRDGRDLSKVYKEDRPLYAAAATYLGTWRAAMKAAGFQVRRQQWTRRRVIDELQRRQRERRSLEGVWKEDGLLYAAAIRVFGRWHKALEAAGLAGKPGKRRRPSATMNQGPTDVT